MNNILAFSGRKQSGKNTSFNFLLGIVMQNLSIVKGSTSVDSEGRLVISDIFGDKDFEGIFDIDRNTREMGGFRLEYIYPYIQNYSFADVLKKDICINVLGLEWESCYGTDFQKKQPTRLNWEDMPGVITPDHARELSDTIPSEYGLSVNKGPMTGRDVMQFVGTEIFRKMYSNVWADTTINKIKIHKSLMSVITDCRFPNEVETVKKAGGKVVRFTRNPFPKDNHDSETALDSENYDWSNFDEVIDNENMSINEQNDAVFNLLIKWGWLTPANEEVIN